MGAFGYPPYTSSHEEKNEHGEPAPCPTNQTPVYIPVPGPPGPMGMPGASPSLEPACYSGWLDLTDTSTTIVPLAYVGGPCLLDIQDDYTFLPSYPGRYMISLVAYVQIDDKFILNMKLSSAIELNMFGTAQVITDDGDVVGSTGIVGLNTVYPYSITARLKPLLSDITEFEETQRVTINAYFVVV